MPPGTSRLDRPFLVFPEGTGQPNPKGLDFYSRLVDELLHEPAGTRPDGAARGSAARMRAYSLPEMLRQNVGATPSR